MFNWKVAVFASVFALGLAWGQDEAAAAAVPKEAEALLVKYLDAVKAKKWPEARKLIHPRTLEVIAERKKRLGKEDHPLAAWTFEKSDYYLKAYKVKAATTLVPGTWVIDVAEDNYQVVEKGISEGDAASYLLGKKDGKWHLVDKRRNETFSASAIKLGYKGFFDKVQEAAAE